MKRLVRLLFLITWITGAVAGGYTVDPGLSTTEESARVVAQTDWMLLTTTGDRLVLAVGHGHNAWRLAAPVPSFVREWLRTPEARRPDPRRAASTTRRTSLSL